MSSTMTVTTSTPQQSVPATGTANALTGFDRSRFNIEWPKTKEAERKWQLEQMAGAFRVFARLGFADGGSGHISLRGEHVHAFTTNYTPISNLSVQIPYNQIHSGSTHMVYTLRSSL
jgi:hypothetical protein